MTTPDRRTARHAATKAEIVDAAWRLARERGLAGWTLRDVAETVGMRAPSLYVYFDNKNALYDAMFADGNAELLRRARAAADDVALRRPPAAEVLRIAAFLYFDFCVEDPARYQLLYLRTIPGFAPSETSFALAQEALDRGTAVLRGVGAGDRIDLWTALLAGLVTQQVSNDPGGNRWRRLVDPAVEMFMAAM